MNQRWLAVAVRAALCLALALPPLLHIIDAPLPLDAPRKILLTAVVLDLKESRGTQIVTLEDLRSHARYLTTTQGTHLAPGDAVRVAGIKQPFDTARNPGAFSPENEARLHGLTAEIDQVRLTFLNSRDCGAPRFWPARFRLWAQRTMTAIFPSAEAAVLTGMLWGDHRELGYEDVRAFSITGTSHLLVTAGLHLGCFAGMLQVFLRLLTLDRKVAAIVTLGAIWLICIISDAHIPSVRAAVMLSALLGAAFFGAEVNSMYTLVLAFCITVCVEPNALGDPSCYLSFSCVFAILQLAERFETYLKKRHVHSFFAKAFAVTFAAQLGTWALIAAQFHLISLIAAPANLCAIPLALLALTLSPMLLLAVALHHASFIAAFAFPIHLVLAALLAIVRFCAGVPLAAMTVHAPARWTLLLYEGTLCFSCWLCCTPAIGQMMLLAHVLKRNGNERLRTELLKLAFHETMRVQIACIALAGASFCVLLSSASCSHTLRITMLDVGQGDGIVIETPGGHTVLIDSGGRLELHANNLAESPAELAASRVLLPFLQYEGISHIDLLLLTHPHGDHVGGAAPVLRTLPVTAFLDSGQTYSGLAYQDAVHEAARHHVPRFIAHDGQTISFDDGVTLQILAPFLPLFRNGKNDINENSIVVLLSYRGVRMLFTGDAGMQAEQQLLAAGVDLHADILKVGHHGSAYASSAAFLQAVHPRIALISVGRHNLFHHPAAATLERLAVIGARIYRTDRCGAITIQGNTISSMLPCN